MLRSIIIGPDDALGEYLQNFLQSFGQVAVLRRVAGYPGEIELMRVVRAHAPHIVFLGANSVAEVGRIVATLERETPGVQVVGLHRTRDPELLLELMRMGVREFLTHPLDASEFRSALARIEEKLEREPPEHGATDRVYAFLPAKAGVGSSTIVLNVALALSGIPDNKTLLIDFDLSCGILRFLLKLDSSYSVVDACERASSMDEEVWPQLVCSYNELDLLHSGEVNPHLRIEGIQVRYLLDFARRYYDVICVDLSGNLERYAAEVMQEAKRIYLVTTEEIAALHLAKEKLKFLHTLDVEDRVSLLINRTQKRSRISPKEIERLLRVPVAATFPNDYPTVQRATQEGTAVASASDLGKRIQEFARTLAEIRVSPTETAKKRLSELFSLSLFHDKRAPADA